MSGFSTPYPGADDRFARSDRSADATSVAAIRGEFSTWLRRGGALDETRLCDVILAVNEALANAAEFAYADGGAGRMDLEAFRDQVRRTLTVRVSDRGHWRETDPLNRRRCRGRGIPLMRTLADSVVIDTSGLGTSVCLRFDDVRHDLPVQVGAG